MFELVIALTARVNRNIFFLEIEKKWIYLSEINRVINQQME